MTLKNWIKNKKVPSIFIAAVLTFSVIAAIPTAHSQTIIFQDDYSTNTGWTQVGTGVTVDDPSFPDIVKFNAVPDASDRRVFKSLGTTLSDTEWILESEFIATAHNLPAHRVFALTAGSGEIFASNQDAIGLFYTDAFTPGIGFQVVQKDDASESVVSSKIIVGIGDKVYIRLARTSATTGTLEIFSDAARTIHVPGSPVAITGFLPTVTGLNTLQHANGFEGGAPRNLTAEIDNTTIFSGVAPPSTCDGLTPTIEGTGGNDLLIGTPGDDVIVGLGGNDVIIGNGGNDTICGGDGNDLIRGGSGDDTIFGGAGKDLIMGESGDDVLNGGANDDQLVGGSGDDTLNGNAGDDMLVGNAGDDSLNGGNGTDICDASDGFDTTTECELPT